jgi:hypothetical protein
VLHVYHPPCWVISAPHNRNSFKFHTGRNLSPNSGYFFQSAPTHVHQNLVIYTLPSSLVCWESTLSRIWTLPGRCQTLLSKLPNLHPCHLGQQASKQLFLFPYCIWFLLPLLCLKPLFFFRIEACICSMTICCII